MKNGDDLIYLKCDFKYVIERRVRMITVFKKRGGKEKKCENGWEANLSKRQVPSLRNTILEVGTLEDPNEDEPIHS